MFTRSKMTTKLKIVINLAQVLVNVSWEMSKSAVSSSVQSLKYLSTGTKHCGAKSCQRQSASHIEHSHHDVFPGVFKPPCSFAYAAYQYQEFQSEKFFDSVPCILLNMCFIKKKKKKAHPSYEHQKPPRCQIFCTSLVFIFLDLRSIWQNWPLPPFGIPFCDFLGISPFLCFWLSPLVSLSLFLPPLWILFFIFFISSIQSKDIRFLKPAYPFLSLFLWSYLLLVLELPLTHW